MTELYKELEKYKELDYYPFHMPGHKRNRDAAEGGLAESIRLDITEIDGFDNLHQAEGILKKEQEKVSRMYGSGHSYFLVNGSTCGILSAVFAVTERGDSILMARNCHKAVYHAAYLRELKTVYLLPVLLKEKDGKNPGMAGWIEPETVERALEENPDCAAVIVTSPTYEGVVSDVKRIAEIAHSHGVPLIVDEAHGAHFGFHDAYPPSSVRLGADLVIHSVHKTLPSMTQTALLHWNGNLCGSGTAARKVRPGEYLAERQELERYLRIFQSSSPSYVLMASVSNCMRLVQEEGRQRLDRLLANRSAFMEKMKLCRYVTVSDGEPDAEGMHAWRDPCKLVIGIAGGKMTGRELYDILLNRYHLQMEMAAPDYVLAIVTMMDTQEGWSRLADALLEIDSGWEAPDGKKEVKGYNEIGEHKAINGCEEIDGYKEINGYEGVNGNKQINGKKEPGEKRLNEGKYFSWGKEGNVPEAVTTIAEAYHGEQEAVGLAECAGRTAAEFINLYPPGIPLAVPGERLTGEMAECLLRWRELRLNVQGADNGLVKVTRTMKETNS